MRSLYWLKTVTQGWQSYALEQSNIASTLQALRLANRDCDSISINRTALVEGVGNIAQ